MIGHHLVLFAFLLTALAGLATAVGSVIAFFWRRTNRRFLSVVLGFSAGVMIYVSFVELLPDARTHLGKAYGMQHGAWIAAAAFFVGILVIALIDLLVPSYENPHAVHSLEELDAKPAESRRLMRVGLLTALALIIHNFPEGLATFAATLSDPRIGISIAIAVAIHNIPEGIAVSVPVYFATGSRKKAFWISSLTGLSEPAGAALGYLILRPFLSDALLGVLFASVAGIMVFISLDELLPTAREYGQEHAAIYGLVAGMAVMAVSLLLGQ